ncbi:MAG TPA: hypothetical protein VGF66_09600 [Gaiellaceae bacterium]
MGSQRPHEVQGTVSAIEAAIAPAIHRLMKMYDQGDGKISLSVSWRAPLCVAYAMISYGC